MINKLLLKNAFVHKNATFEFKPGYTGITGKNGLGKSLILEMAQYALWGVKALRGVATDYKKTEVVLDFTIRDKNYLVVRGPKETILSDDKGPIATGVKAVNSAIRNLFGFSYEAFKVANAINQGEIEKFGQMKPMERKAMVDETLGLSILDTLVTRATDELKTINGKLAGLAINMVEPVAPAVPPNLRPTSEVRQALEEAKSVKTEKDVLSREAKVVPYLPPVPVATNPKISQDRYLDQLVELREVQDKRLEVGAEIMTLRRERDAIPDATMTKEEIAAGYEANEAYQLFHQRLAAHKTNVKLIKEGWDRERLAYSRAVSNYESRRAQQVERCCPNCNHVWHEGPDLGDAPVEPTPPTYPIFDEKEPDTPPSMKSLSEASIALEKASYKAELSAKIAAKELLFLSLEDPTDLIKDMEVFIQGKQTYDFKYQHYLKEKQQVEDAKQALSDPKFEGIEDRIALLQGEIESNISYEALLESYQTALQLYTRVSAQVEVEKKRQEDWQQVREAISLLRTKVKGHFLPSLNQVASLLITQMTGGVLNRVDITEDFSIIVDGQRLETLSGAGKAVANLAIRIGLGQVLTHRTFGVMMLDEIDQGYDNDRAKATADSLARLAGMIPQIIQVSHKAIETEYKIEL